MKQEMMWWQWHQLDHMQIICTSLQTDNHVSTSPLSFLQARCSSSQPTNSVKALKAKIPGNHTTTVLRPFFRDHPGELLPEENFWTLWCKGRLTEADTLNQLGATPSRLTCAHLHHPPPIFFRGRMPFLSLQRYQESAIKTVCILYQRQRENSYQLQVKADWFKAGHQRQK